MLRLFFIEDSLALSAFYTIYRYLYSFYICILYKMLLVVAFLFYFFCPALIGLLSYVLQEKLHWVMMELYMNIVRLFSTFCVQSQGTSVKFSLNWLVFSFFIVSRINNFVQVSSPFLFNIWSKCKFTVMYSL